MKQIKKILGSHMFLAVFTALFILIFSSSFQPKVAALKSFSTLSYSPTPADWGVDAECNPGGGTTCNCTNSDVALVNHASYMQVIANPNKTNTWVNAIARVKKPTLPGNLPLKPATIAYSGQFQLPTVPKPDVSQTLNGQADHFMIDMYDGQNQFGWGNKISMEAALYWQINPWQSDYGYLYVYSTNQTLVDTGLRLAPDTNWHSFKTIANFQTQKWLSVTVDNKTASLINIPLLSRSMTGWGTEQVLINTVEAEPAWPKATCTYVTSWSINFKNILLQTL